jgi:hypothetical protein
VFVHVAAHRLSLNEAGDGIELANSWLLQTPLPT